MNRQYIRDNQVIERYLQGRLTADEEGAFEEAYLGDPDLFKELEAADLLRRGLKDLEAAKRNELSPRAAVRATAAPRRYALAASLVAGIAIAASAYLYGEHRALSEGLFTGEGASGARLVPLLAVRGGDTSFVEAATTDDWTVLLLDPGFTPYDHYRAVLVRRAAPADGLLSVDRLVPSYEGLLGVVVPSRLLTPGEYEIVLTGRMRDWSEQRASDDLGRTGLTVTPAP